MLAWHPESSVRTYQNCQIPLRYREHPNSRDNPCSTTGNNSTTFAVTIASGPRARAKRPRRSSRRSPSSRSRIPRPPPSTPRGNRASSRSCRRHRSATRKSRHRSTPSPGPRASQIPRSEHARIRTWVQYGLTIPQCRAPAPNNRLG
jgi:hypothetical protein